MAAGERGSKKGPLQSCFNDAWRWTYHHKQRKLEDNGMTSSKQWKQVTTNSVLLLVEISVGKMRSGWRRFQTNINWKDSAAVDTHGGKQ